MLVINTNIEEYVPTGSVHCESCGEVCLESRSASSAVTSVFLPSFSPATMLEQPTQYASQKAHTNMSSYAALSSSETRASAHDLAPDEDSDDEFIYPGAADDANGASPMNVTLSSQGSPSEATSSEESPPEPERPPERAADEQPSAPVPASSLTTPRPSPAQLEALYAAASSGDLRLLKNLFRNALDTAEVEPFALANDASTRTGLTALHAASSRGYLDIVMWCKPSMVHSSVLSLTAPVLQWSTSAGLCPT